MDGPREACVDLLDQVLEVPVTGLHEGLCTSKGTVSGLEVEHGLASVVGQWHEAAVVANGRDLVLSAPRTCGGVQDEAVVAP